MTAYTNNNQSSNTQAAKTEEVDLSKITKPEEMLRMASEERLKLAQLKTLIEIHPGIVKGSIEAMQALSKVSETAGSSQVEALATLKQSVSGTLEVLKILAQNAQTDSTRERIAEHLLELSRQHKEMGQISERMNQGNNKLWKRVALGIGSAAALVVGGVAVAATLKK